SFVHVSLGNFRRIRWCLFVGFIWLNLGRIRIGLRDSDRRGKIRCRIRPKSRHTWKRVSINRESKGSRSQKSRRRQEVPAHGGLLARTIPRFVCVPLW